jgi:hypothetical protein
MVPYADTDRIQEVHESIEKSHNSEAGTKRAISRAQCKIKEQNMVTIEDAYNDHFEDNRYKNNEDEHIKLFTSIDKKIGDNIDEARNLQKRNQIIFESIDESGRDSKPKVYVPYQSDEESGKSL